MEYECTKYFEQPRGYLQGENENGIMIDANVSKNVCTLSYYHHQIGSMTHLILFRLRSWNNGMRCIAFYIRKERLCAIMYPRY